LQSVSDNFGTYSQKVQSTFYTRPLTISAALLVVFVMAELPSG